MEEQILNVLDIPKNSSLNKQLHKVLDRIEALNESFLNHRQQIILDKLVDEYDLLVDEIKQRLEEK